MTDQESVVDVAGAFADWWCRHEKRQLPGQAQTVGLLVDECAAEFGDRIAFRAPSAMPTFREVQEQSLRAAQAFADLGLSEGDRIAASDDNDVDLIVAFAGAMRLGLIWVGINKALAPAEKIALLRDCQAQALLASDAVAAEMDQLRGELPGLRDLIRVREWRQVLEHSSRLRHSPDIDSFAPAAIAYTSGTTGRPKGVVHSQHNILLPGLVARRREEPFRRQLCMHPLTILNIMVVDILSGMRRGMTTTVMNWVGAEKIAQVIERDRIETARMAPPMAYDLLHSPDVTAESLASLVNPIVGGGDMPEASAALFSQRFGTPPRGAYGLTEAMNGCARERADEPHRQGCSGPAYEHLELMIRGKDGEPLAPGEVGELCVAPARSGDLAGVWTPMLGYWRQPGLTRQALRDGVLHTGDLASLDESGRLYIRGRVKDMIVRGGANVSPAEVERVIAQHPGVAETVVLGRDHARLGQEVVAVVRRAPGAAVSEQELIDHCRGLLARYKAPVAVEFVEEIPHTAVGKVAKRELAALFANGAVTAVEHAS